MNRLMWPVKVLAGATIAMVWLGSIYPVLGQGVLFDVNDISFLWPVPKTKHEADALIATDEKLADGQTSIWPHELFKQVIAEAKGVEVIRSSGSGIRIRFPGPDFDDPRVWKIAGIRVDGSAPGSHEKLAQAFGSRPQIRLIVQPVTEQGPDSVRVHDVTAHLVFDFVSRMDPPLAEGLPPRGVPDRDAFMEILNDLKQIKDALADNGVVTTGASLGIHPGFAKPELDLTTKLRALLQRHLTSERLNAISFMGIRTPEPWLFFAMSRTETGFKRISHPSISLRPAAQMVNFTGGAVVVPTPKNNMFGPGVGLSTSPLFLDDAENRLDQLVFGPEATGLLATITNADIPDIIANPFITSFGTTDCASCHTESALRRDLSIRPSAAPLRFNLPPGISSVDENRLPQDRWNLRNFGWGPTFGGAVETVTVRTANEAAESADFINNHFLQANAKPVANPLTLVMKIKSPEDFQRLKALVEGMQALPRSQNPIATALDKIGNVHFARFVFLGEDHLLVITTYDGDFERYIHLFVDEIGTVFDKLLPHIVEAPPTPVADHRDEFLTFVQSHDLKCVEPFYSAYPALETQDVLTLQRDASVDRNSSQ